jgi:solute carrier family 25 protein 38
MATSPYFAPVRQRSGRDLNSSVLPKLTSGGNLLAGASARVAVGFLLNPFTLLKARFEVGLIFLSVPPFEILTISNHV